MTDATNLSAADLSGLSFEQALAELEKIVAELESGQAPLERSIDKLNEDLMSIFTTLHTGEFVDPACDPEVVLERLGEVHTQLSTSRDGGRHSCSHIPTPTFVLRALPLPTTGAHAARGDRRAS